MLTAPYIITERKPHLYIETPDYKLGHNTKGIQPISTDLKLISNIIPIPAFQFIFNAGGVTLPKNLGYLRDRAWTAVSPNRTFKSIIHKGYKGIGIGGGDTSPSTYSDYTFTIPFFPITIEVLYEVSSSTYHYPMALGYGGISGRLIAFQDASGSSHIPQYWVYNTTEKRLNATTSTTPGDIVHVVGTSASQSDHKIYVNGVLSNTWNSDLGFSYNILRKLTLWGISFDNSYIYNTKIFKAAVYTESLSANQIYQLYKDPYLNIVEGNSGV